MSGLSKQGLTPQFFKPILLTYLLPFTLAFVPDFVTGKL